MVHISPLTPIAAAPLTAPERPIASLTLADVIARLQADPALSAARRREMISALRTTARLLDLPPAGVPADPRHLRQRFQDLAPAACGFSRRRWSNLRSLVLGGLKLAGVPVLPGRAYTLLSADWSELRSLLPDTASRHELSRFMSFCSAQGIAPRTISAANFNAFRQTLENDSLVRKPATIYRKSCKVWNKAAGTILGWPDIIVDVPGDHRRYAMEWSEFPETFRADANAFLQRLGNQDPFADTYAVSVKSSTAKMRRKQIRQLATALARAGKPASAITDLSVLVEPANGKLALRFLYDRAGGKSTKYLHQQAQLLKTIAWHWVRAPAEDLDQLASVCRRLALRQTGMTAKNRARLRQFDNQANVSALINLPRRVLNDLPRIDEGDRSAALRAMLAIAIEFLVTAPMRVNNLTSLRMDRHLVPIRVGRSNTLHLVIPAEETKNGEPYELQLSAETENLLSIYRSRYHTRICAGASQWLFPNEAGERRSTTTFAKAICNFVLRETGIQVNVHLFRHIAVKLYLDRHPEDVETVRRLLGHKSINTTLRYYAELRTADAFRSYDATIRELRETNISPRRKTRRSAARS